MALSFGTSGLRGLVTEFDATIVGKYVKAFIQVAQKKYPSARDVIIGGDYRSSTPKIREMITSTLDEIGVRYNDAGLLPTPALAYSCQAHNSFGLMITGSHIPDDRNGIKFYFPDEEILKDDESAIVDILSQESPDGFKSNTERTTLESSAPKNHEELFVDRYAHFFGPSSLNGLRLLFYEHSSASKVVLPKILERLGARVDCALPSEKFVPVDTEALDDNPELQMRSSSGKYFATLSTDGDGDRPLLIDEVGKILKGDQIGTFAALELQATVIVTPISSNSSISKIFPKTIWTKIGSPFVIEAIKSLPKNKGDRFVGFEANGGFMLGSDIRSESKTLEKLWTRDSVLPMLLTLNRAIRLKIKLSELVKSANMRSTQSAVVRGINPHKSRQLLEELSKKNEVCGLGMVELNKIDGMKFVLAGGDSVHFRPSGNAPEFRIYVEAQSEQDCELLMARAKMELSKIL